MNKIGYGRTRDQLTIIVKTILDQDGRSNPFKDNRPGKFWIKGFMKRHPNLTVRKSQTLGVNRALSCTPLVLDKWFREFKAFLKEHNILDFPSRIYNCDESGFPLSARVGKPVGCRSVNKVTSGNKQQITTLACYNAAGDIVPPFHVFPGERFKQNPLQDAVPNSYFGRSDNGWMTTSLFYGWLGNHFVKCIPPSRPVVLIVDGHGSHIDMEVSKLAIENQVLLYCLPPHCTHCLQPCDVGFFKPLKSNWDKAVEEWEVEHLGEVLSKYEFAGVFRHAWEATVKVSTLVNSFKATGLCPLNRSAIPDDVLGPATVYQSPEDEGEVGDNVGANVDEEKSSEDMEDENSENNWSEEQKNNEEGGIEDKEENGSANEEGSDDDEEDGLLLEVGANEVVCGTAVATSLQELEGTLTRSQIERYTLRLEEGFDLTSDEVYLQWKRLKLTTAETSTQRTPTTNSHSPTSSAAVSTPLRQKLQPQKKVSPVFTEILSYPDIKSKKGKQKASREKMPSHLTSEQFIKLCEEKERKKQEEEEEKARKKLEREEKALQRKKEQEEKAELRKKKQEERAKKKAEDQQRKEERKRENERKRQERQSSRGKKRPPSHSNEPNASSSSNQPEGGEEPSTSNRPKRRKVVAQTPCCALCGTPEDSEDADEDWVQCSQCSRWYEETCAGVCIEDIKDLEWFCESCIDM